MMDPSCILPFRCWELFWQQSGQCWSWLSQSRKYWIQHVIGWFKGACRVYWGWYIWRCCSWHVCNFIFCWNEVKVSLISNALYICIFWIKKWGILPLLIEYAFKLSMDFHLLNNLFADWGLHVRLNGENSSIRVLSIESQHTRKSTGLMLWESAQLMATVQARKPNIVSGKKFWSYRRLVVDASPRWWLLDLLTSW